jgi:Na+-transporting NADH:ubiquinone oxidoreductase subunit C
MNDTLSKTLIVAISVSLVCAIFISTASVMLRPAQLKNIELDKQKNILQAAGLFDPSQSIEQQFAAIEAIVVELKNGQILPIDANTLDPIKASKTPDNALSQPIANLGVSDNAKLGRRENQTVVYLVKKDNQLDKIILPIRGYGLWSTLYGFLALEGDANTIAGIGFYQHGETPGLGGEVDNENWKKQFIGKQLYRDDSDEVVFHILKGKALPDSPNAKYEVDGLAGATLTTRGVDNLIKFWLGYNGFKPFLKRIQQGESL